MPRPIRLKSENGLYHVMARGNRRKVIFHNDEDKKRFINILSHKKKDVSFTLLAFCIMDNHYHLLIKEEKESLSTIMKMINSTYATHYNSKYEGIGHVFQDRYRSEAIHNDTYLLSVARYIHNNPKKAGMVNNCRDYPWSSYQNYIYYKKNNELLNVSYILDLYSLDKDKAVNKFMTFTEEANTDLYLDDFCEKEEEDKIRKYIESVIEETKISKDEIMSNRKYIKLRSDIIRNIKANSMLQISKIANILGIDKQVIYRVKL